VLRRTFIALTCLLLAGGVVSCGDSGSTEPDTSPPTVTEVSVADGATDVGLISQLRVTFSEAMDSSSINDTTIVVEGRSVTGTVNYDAGAHAAVFTPDTLYAAEAPYSLTVTADVTDADGNPIEEAHTTSFTTGTFDCDHLQDYLEPNDVAEEAAIVETDRLYPTLSVCGDDEDYFVFTLEEPKTVWVTTTFKHADSESWGIHFVRPDGVEYEATLGMTADTGESGYFHYSFPAGTHGVRIYAHHDPVYVLYDLTLETSAPCDEDPYEDNDFIEDAYPTTPGHLEGMRGCYLDPDYFSFDVTEGQTVTITATQTGPGSVTLCRIRIFDPLGQQTVDQEYESPFSLSAVMGASGTCSAMAMFWSDVDYELDIDVAD
jgi:hypothetical protein